MGHMGHVSETGVSPAAGPSRAPRSGQKQRPGGADRLFLADSHLPALQPFVPFVLCVSHQSLQLVALCWKKYRGGQQAKAAKQSRALVRPPASCSQVLPGAKRPSLGAPTSALQSLESAFHPPGLQLPICTGTSTRKPTRVTSNWLNPPANPRGGKLRPAGSFVECPPC